MAGLVTLGPLLCATEYFDRVGPALEPPSREHWLGTDELGRDEWLRLLVGGRVSLAVAAAAAMVAALVGTSVGFAAGLGGHWLDGVLMRLTDAFLAVPALPVLMILAAVDLEKPLAGVALAFGGNEHTAAALAQTPLVQGGRMVFALTLFSWMGTARLVRAQVAGLRQREFIVAARAAGVGDFRLCWRHMLPHCYGPILVAAAGSVSGNLLYEAVLGFLGLGLPPPTPTWGSMLHAARIFGTYRAPWLVYFPGLCITFTVLCTNRVTDALQEWADPRSSEKMARPIV